jgi:two-component system sensor histidine kinase UhpB
MTGGPEGGASSNAGNRPPLPRRLAAVVLTAVAAVALSFALRWFVDIPDRPATPESYLGNLVAAALCITGALTIRSYATATWLAIAGSALLATFNSYAVVRTAQAVEPAATWPWLVLTAEVALLAGSAITGAYAVHRRAGAARWVRIGVPAVAAVVAVTIVVAAGAALAEAVGASDPATRSVVALRISGRVGMGFAIIGFLVGAARDLAGPASRAQERLLEMPMQARGASLAVFLRLLRDEMLRSDTVDRREAVEQERARLAADLHALVLPELRKAAAAAEASGGPDDPLASGLRNTLADIEQLMHARQSLVLEQFGLAAALEWLAERVEERSMLEVELVELGGQDEASTPATAAAAGATTAAPERTPGPASAMPIARQRAAFRVALLALDNVVRHAGAKTATITFGSDDRRQWLAVVDDGRGMVVAAGDQSRRGRGLTDMQAEATATGARFDLTTTAEGTRVEIAWFGPLRSST